MSENPYITVQGKRQRTKLPGKNRKTLLPSRLFFSILMIVAILHVLYMVLI